jgi:methylthioribose-1-phosphate isomerase
MNIQELNELPFLLRPENVSRYENGDVFILDRRVYPFEVRYEHCRNYEETAQAIKNMVTQSSGPFYATGHGMIQAAHQAAGKSAEGIEAELEKAAQTLISARPTADFPHMVAKKMLRLGKAALAAGKDVEAELIESFERETVSRYADSMTRGRHAASLLKDGDVVLNHCWAEATVVHTLYAAQQQGKKLEAICTETRPYLQGARLTSDAIADLGIPTTIVTDGMPGYLMSQGRINVYFTGADRITMSGHVINKIGTLQIAIAAHHYKVPYYVFSIGPDRDTPGPDEVVIEERDPEDVLHCLGMRTATTKVKGLYPAFDITPPEMVSAVVTIRGVFSPYALKNYYADET